MKNVKIVLILICCLLVIKNNSIVAYAACPISSSTSEAASAEAREYYNMLPSGVRNALDYEAEKYDLNLRKSELAEEIGNAVGRAMERKDNQIF